MLQSSIYYEGRFHRLIPNTEKGCYLTDEQLKIPVTSSPVLCRFRENDIVYNKSDYYRIISSDYSKPFEPIPCKKGDSYDILYKIRLLTDVNNELCDESSNRTDTVSQDQLSRVNKDESDKLRTLSTAINKYNSTLRRSTYIDKEGSLKWIRNKYAKSRSEQFDEMAEPQFVSLPYAMRINEKLNLRSTQIIELTSIMKRTYNAFLQLRYVIEIPFSFIKEDWELFNFDKALRIYEEHPEYPRVSDQTKLFAWIYSYVHSKKSFYIEKRILTQDFEKMKYKIYKSPPKHLYSISILVLKVIDGHEYYTTQFLMDKEKTLGDDMIGYFHEKRSNLEIDLATVHRLITEFETEFNIILGEDQRESVINHIILRLSITTGYPGTGKTKIVECFLYVLLKLGMYKNISLSAPTGLAYKNILERTSVIGEFDTSASGTCHKVVFNDCHRVSIAHSKHSKSTRWADTNLHGFRHQEQIQRGTESDQEQMTNIDIFIVDEVSMVDIFMFSRIIEQCIHFNSKLILIGDVNQLPSIGPGKILHSIIESGLFDDNIVRLMKIQRQNCGALLRGIEKMAHEENIVASDFDGETLTHIDMNPQLVSLDIEVFRELFVDRGYSPENMKMLCFNSDSKKPVNTMKLNHMLQSIFNSQGEEIKGPSWAPFMFKVGDRIILKHNEEQEANDKKSHYRANGDEAIIVKKINSEGKPRIQINYLSDKNIHNITDISLDTLYQLYDPSYALSVHKSQGSQYNNIIFIINDTYMLSRAVLFTGISRAKNQCIIISKMSDFIKVQQQYTSKPSIFMKEFIETEFE
jgi:exodeoxyribonuclease V alpha subunit